MCGITGWIHWEKDVTQELPIVQKMTETLSRRGPDAIGMWMNQHVAFGHRRLSVVDPVGGAQPMTKNRGDYSYTMIYNGELYNTEDIRRDLLQRGHQFRSHSDTEVLLTAYMEWGSDCLERLNGIFAFAIWDEIEQRVFIARDRMGVKPLFYAEREHSFVFGSELKSVLAHPNVKPVIDREGLAEVFMMGPSRTPGHGVFRGIKELKPGHYLEIDRSGVRTTAYWSLASKPHEDDFETTVSTVRSLLLDSIERQLVSDVPLATLLSGGLDSSIITAVAADVYKREGKGKLHTYSIDYVGNDQYFKANAFQPDEDTPWVKRVSEFADSEPHFFTFDTPELVDALKTAVLARDLPAMADVDASLYLFCREIKKETTVVLSGECADEVFGGYPWFYREDLLASDTFPWMRHASQRVTWLSDEMKQIIRPEAYLHQRYQETLDEVPRLAGEDPLEARRREMFYLNITWFMSTLLDRKDRMSMYASLEARVPFCDHRLVEYVWNIPWAMKRYKDREKGILRKAVEGILPDDVLYRKKSPYPKTHNPAYAAATRNWLLEVLNDPSSPLLPLIDQKIVHDLTKEDASASNLPWFGQLMSTPQLFAYLAQIDFWLREYKVSIV
ncbi:asparagine synthase (glutamine-hydrolyzing) [Brevibacillus sp. SYSU BS000544]|uniref:asparagine synthase (glutamine-hydrolyzing) n=1 Tax=Brevibacillus sp. SYSU BS000544 TaxID=3416443 RepID=UPI003CE5BE35